MALSISSSRSTRSASSRPQISEPLRAGAPAHAKSIRRACGRRSAGRAGSPRRHRSAVGRRPAAGAARRRQRAATARSSAEPPSAIRDLRRSAGLRRPGRDDQRHPPARASSGRPRQDRGLRALADKRGATSATTVRQTLLQLAGMVPEPEEGRSLGGGLYPAVANQAGSRQKRIRIPSLPSLSEPGAIRYLAGCTKARRLGTDSSVSSARGRAPLRRRACAQVPRIAKLAAERASKARGPHRALGPGPHPSDRRMPEALGALAGLYGARRTSTNSSMSSRSKAEVTFDNAVGRHPHEARHDHGDRLNSDEGRRHRVARSSRSIRTTARRRKPQEEVPRPRALGRPRVFYAERQSGTSSSASSSSRAGETDARPKIGMLFKDRRARRQSRRTIALLRPRRPSSSIRQNLPRGWRPPHPHLQSGRQQHRAMNTDRGQLGHEEDPYSSSSAPPQVAALYEGQRVRD